MTEYVEGQVFYPYKGANDRAGYHFWCPGCDSYHGVITSPGGWTFNGDVVTPTVKPSILVRGGKTRCHSFVEEGQIRFLSDCTHALAGQTIPLVADRRDG